MVESIVEGIIPENDAQRLAALHRYKVFDTPPLESFKNMARLIADVFNVPIALISLVDKDKVFFKGNVGMPGVRYTDRSASLCSFAILSSEPTIFDKPLEEHCLLSNPLVHGEFGLRFYAAAPLTTADGFHIGAVCIVDKKERTFSPLQKDMLVRFARMAMNEIELRQAAAEQAVIEQEQKTFNEELGFVMDTMPQLVWATRADGYSDFFNKGWFDYTGHSFDDVKGDGWTRSLHPDDFDQTLKVWTQAVKTGTTYDVEYRLRRHDGEYRWFVARGTPAKDAKGTILRWYGTTTDIHEKKKIEEALKDSDQRFQNLIRQAPVGIVVLRGVEMIVEVANEAYSRLIGRASETLIHQPLFQVIPEAESSFQPFLDRVRTTGEPLSLFDHPYQIFSEGEMIEGYLNIVYQPYKEVDGTVKGIMVLCQDVTTQVTARRKVEEALEQARLAVASAELGTYNVDLQTNQMITSERMYQIFDVTHGGDRSEFISALHSDDLPIRNKAYQKAFSDGLLEYEARIVKKDGSIRWIRVKGKVFFDKANKPVKLLGVVQDITDEKKFAEELTRQVVERTAELIQSQGEMEEVTYRLQAVFNTAQSGMFIFAPVRDEQGEIVDFRFVITNPTFAAYVNQTPEIINGALGSTWFPGYLHNGVFDMYKKTYLTGETQRQDIHYNVDQHDIYLDLMSNKVGEEVLVTFTDYTALKKAQAQLEKHVEDLKRSNQDLEEFAYAASHDLKEPVRKIRFFGDRLKNSLDGRLNNEEVQFFDRMEAAARRMGALIDDLLTYSQANQKPKEYDCVDLNELIKLVIGDLDLQIEEKRAVIEVGPLRSVKGYPRQLQQAFQNLISNALKYSKPNDVPVIQITGSKVLGLQINQALSTEEQRKEFYAIEVQDNCIGFEQQDAEKIFNVFTRLHNNSEFKGTGVGLAIVRKILGNHNGYVTAEGKPGNGSKFKMFLPL